MFYQAHATYHKRTLDYSACDLNLANYVTLHYILLTTEYP